jgi:hypothetical protein
VATCSYSRCSHDGAQDGVRTRRAQARSAPERSLTRRRLFDTTVANGTASVGLGRAGRKPHGSGGTTPPDLTQEVRSESPSRGAEQGRFPRSPLAASEGRRFSALGHPPAGQGFYRAGGTDARTAGPEPSGGPSQTTIACALKETPRSSIEADPRVGIVGPDSSRRPCRAREGERSQPIRGAANANGMAAVWGDSFHGMDREKTPKSPNAPPAARRTPG